MNLHPTSEQVMLRDSIERFARDHAEDSPESLLVGLAALGLLALPVPETASGLGGQGFDLMAMMQAVGQALLPVPMVGSLAALDLLGHHGSAVQQERWLAPAMDGELRLAFARTDGGAQTDRQMTASLPLVPGADTADAILLIGGGRAQIAATDAEGVQRKPLRMADGVMGAQISLTEVASDRIDAAPEQLDDVIARACAACAAQILGIMDRLLADTLDYVRTREQFGTPIGRFQTIQHRMARLYTDTEQCRSLVMAAADRSGPRDGWLRRVSAARRLTAERGMHLAQECVQFHGGMGITDELAVSRGHRQMMVLTRLNGVLAAGVPGPM